MTGLDELDLLDQLEDLPDPLAFTPVPLLRTRRNGWTPQRQRDFIRALEATGNVSRAARAVGVTKQSAISHARMKLSAPGREARI